MLPMKEEKISLSMPIKVGLAAFGMATVGVVLGFVGWYVVGSPPLAQLGFFVTVGGVGIGFVAIVVGQVLYGRRAVGGSVKAMKDLRQKFKK
jgi:hypothetical protein